MLSSFKSLFYPWPKIWRRSNTHIRSFARCTVGFPIRFILPKTMVWYCHVSQAIAINRPKSEICSMELFFGPASILTVLSSARNATWAMVLLLTAHQQWFHSESFQSKWRIFRNTFVSICFVWHLAWWTHNSFDEIELYTFWALMSNCYGSHADTPDTHVSIPRLATVETSLFNYCQCWRAATILWQV